jgi:hypothetical protein
MNAKFLRLFVVGFGFTTLGSLALTPNVSYGQNQSSQANEDAAARIRAQKEYTDGYNRGYEQGRVEEQTRIDNEQFNNSQGNACCGGGQQQQQQQPSR